MKYFVELNGREREVVLEERLGELSVSVDGKLVELNYSDVDDLGQLFVLSGTRSFGVSIEGDTNQIDITIAGHLYEVHIEDEREQAANAAERAAAKGGGLVVAVMPGVVVQILVEPGQAVTEGQPLLILEAMKMQNEIRSPLAGTVQEVHAQQGEAVSAGEKLLLIESDEVSD
ncbi:MAG: biotin carboxyl carrier protein [Candidatus Paceibacteria bacterium]|jgi:biotin carboxyl carrier protein